MIDFQDVVSVRQSSALSARSDGIVDMKSWMVASGMPARWAILMTATRRRMARG